MFQKGEYVVSCSKGVCMVEDITTLNISGIDKEREYYILKPVYLSASTVYIPEDNLYGELAISLQMPRDSVEDFITGKMEK